MIVQAIADFTPGTLRKLLTSLSSKPAEEKEERSRSREREKPNQQRESKDNGPLNDRYSTLSILTLDTEEKPKEEQAQKTKYIYFMKDDLVKVTADAGNGWWYGRVVETFDEAQSDHLEQGFFPSNFVQQLTSMDLETQGKDEEEKKEGGRFG